MNKKSIIGSVVVSTLLLGALILPFAYGQNTYLYSYKVQNGDTLHSIGLKFGVKWLVIASQNGIGSPYTIYVGEILVIPLSSISVHYTVQSGDSLYSISQKYEVTWQSIAQTNGIGIPYTLYVGEELAIPLPAVPLSTSSSATTYQSSSYIKYTVQSGDTLSIIGQKFSVPWQTIAQVNGISYPYTIYVGQVLLIPVSTTTSQTSTSSLRTTTSAVTTSSTTPTMTTSNTSIITTTAITSSTSSNYTTTTSNNPIVSTSSSNRVISSTNTTTSTTTKADPIATGNLLYDQYDSIILGAATKYNLDPMLIKSQIAQESYFNSLAVSSDDPCGVLIQNGIDVGHSYGLMQVTPTCNPSFARNPDGSIDLTTNSSSLEWNNSAFNPAYNIYFAAAAFSNNLQYADQHFANCTSNQYQLMSLSAYNAGWGSVFSCSSYNTVGTTYINYVLNWYQKFSTMSGWPDPYL